MSFFAIESLQDRLHEAMTERLATKGADYYFDFELGDRKVVSFEENEVSDGYCETCYYEYTVVEYTFDDGTTFEETTSLAELMREL